MPLIRNTELPTYKRLAEQGYHIIGKDRAGTQDIRRLHIGLLNLMPDAALEVTERQFAALLARSIPVAQLELHPFTLPLISRSETTQRHIADYYETFDQIKAQGLDALIISGANEETNPPVTESHWTPLAGVLDWALENVTSTMCFCLATHAALTYIHDQPPEWQNSKRWGIYSHRITAPAHPFVDGMNTRFDAAHSRYNEITRHQFETAGLEVLAESADAGVHMAVSRDGTLVCLQAHPEYDTISLLKEYSREVKNFQEGRRPDYPPFPDNYLPEQARAIAARYKNDILAGKNLPFPEGNIAAHLDNTWADSARAIFSNWIGYVYQVTHVDRKKPFMDGLDPGTDDVRQMMNKAMSLRLLKPA